MELLAEFHPRVVHFPIVLFSLYLLFEAISTIFKKEFFSRSAYLSLFLGVLSAVVAVVTGNEALAQAERWFDEGAIIPFGAISDHKDNATIVLWFFTGLLVLRTLYFIYIEKRKKYLNFKTAVSYLFLIAAALGYYFVIITGDLGGKLVFEHGVGTELVNPIIEE